MIPVRKVFPKLEAAGLAAFCKTRGATVRMVPAAEILRFTGIGAGMHGAGTSDTERAAGLPGRQIQTCGGNRSAFAARDRKLEA